MPRMLRFDWMARSARHKCHTPHTRVLRLEPLEDRRLLATIYTVFNTNDSGDFSLRSAINSANSNPGADFIVFHPSVTGTIDLFSQLPTITGPLTINGPGADILTIDAGNGTDGLFSTGDGFRIFDIYDGIDGTHFDVQISGLTLTGGDVVGQGIPARYGGAIRSKETLTITACTITGNAASHGGGVYTFGGNLTIADSTITGNYAVSAVSTANRGGGVFAGAYGAQSTTIVNSTISGNVAELGGGLYIFSPNHNTNIQHSTITANAATLRGGGVTGLNNSGILGEVFSSIIAGNEAPTSDDVHVEGVNDLFVSRGYNVIGSGNAADDFTGPGDLVGVDPKLAPLADNGGPTATHALLPGSPALNAGGFVPLDDFSANNFATDYNFIDLFNAAANNPQVAGGVAHLNVGGGTGAFIWKRGEFLSEVGDQVSVELGFNYPFASGEFIGGASAGLALFNSASGSNLLAEIRVETDETSGVTLRQLNDGATTTNLSGAPSGLMTLAITVTGKTASDATVQITLSGTGFTTITTSRVLPSLKLFFGPVAFDVTGNASIHDNLRFHRGVLNNDQRGSGFPRVVGTQVDSGAFESEIIVVNSTADTNDGLPNNGTTTLREAISIANSTPGANTIGFSPLFDTPQTIAIGSQLPAIADDLTIGGPGADLLTVDAGNGTDNTFGTGDGYRILNVTNDLSSQIFVTISGMKLTGGDINGSGGAIRNNENLWLTEVAIEGNAAVGVSSDGGGIYTVDGNLTVVGSTISNNASLGTNSDGGGISSDTNLSGSQATVLINTTISNNTASRRGGGFMNGDGYTVIQQSTITDNSSAEGGGIWSFGDTFTNTELLTTIVAGNSAPTSPDVHFGVSGTNSFSSSGYNIIGSGNATGDFVATGDQVGVDPQLGPLADNGGPTKTHALAYSSPAIDHGGFTYDYSYDQRGPGFPRFVGTQLDIGAYEYLPLVVNDNGNADDGDIHNGTTTLREAINYANANLAPGLISFAPMMSGATITLGGMELEITDAVVINAAAPASPVTIDAGQQSRVFDITATTGDFTLAGLILIGGVTFAESEPGGAVRSLSSGTLTLDQSAISGSHTSLRHSPGGGIYANGDLVLNQSTVTNNYTARSFSTGGAIFSNGAVTLNQSTVSDNHTERSAGGGIAASAVTLVDSTVSGNYTDDALHSGGGIFSQGNVTLTQSTISGNFTKGYESYGGGIWSGGNVTISQSTVTRNRVEDLASKGGGVSLVGLGTLNIFSSIVADNTAGSSSPDIDPGGSTVTINNSIIGVASGLTYTGSDNLTGTTATPLDPWLGYLANNGGPTKTHALLPGSPAIDAGVERPLALYRFNDSTSAGGQPAQSATGVLNGVYQGGVTLVTPTVPVLSGTAADFNNNNANFVRVLNAGTLQTSGLPTSALTLEAWVNLDSFVSYGGIIAAAVDNGATEGGWYLSSRGDNRFTLFLRTNGGGAANAAHFELATTDTYSTNQWYHVAATYDGAMTRLYVNGALQGSIAQTGSITYPASGDGGLVIGKYLDSDENIPFDGRIDELSIYGVALSGPELALRAAQGPGELIGPVDQRGLERVVDGDGVSGARADIGAYESQGVPSFPDGDYNQNAITDAADYTVWRDALTAGNNLLPNDSTPGLVDESDFLFWRSNFGNIIVPATPVNTGAGAGAAFVAADSAAFESATTVSAPAADVAVAELSTPALKQQALADFFPQPSARSPHLPSRQLAHAKDAASTDDGRLLLQLAVSRRQQDRHHTADARVGHSQGLDEESCGDLDALYAQLGEELLLQVD